MPKFSTSKEARSHWARDAIRVFEARKNELPPYFRDERFYEENYNMHEWFLEHPEDSYLRDWQYTVGRDDAPLLPSILGKPFRIARERKKSVKFFNKIS